MTKQRPQPNVSKPTIPDALIATANGGIYRVCPVCEGVVHVGRYQCAPHGYRWRAKCLTCGDLGWEHSILEREMKKGEAT